jgi:RNA polymerase sigma-70 factor (ECF subfamily)
VQDERELVRRAQHGEPEAFSALYEQHFDKIYRYVVLKVGSRADAEDLTQQAFIRALESIGSYRWRGLPFSSWLFRIAHNQVVDHLRKKGREKRAPFEEAMAVSTADPAQVAEQRLTLERLSEACKQLTEAQREVVYLRFGSELSVAETAGAMHRSQGAVKALQHDAVRRLRRIVFPSDSDV